MIRPRSALLASTERPVRQGVTGPDGAGSTESRHNPGYKWIALSNTTIGVLMAAMNSSIVLIALPDIFRGIGVLEG